MRVRRARRVRKARCPTRLFWVASSTIRTGAARSTLRVARLPPSPGSSITSGTPTASAVSLRLVTGWSAQTTRPNLVSELHIGAYRRFPSCLSQCPPMCHTLNIPMCHTPIISSRRVALARLPLPPDSSIGGVSLREEAHAQQVHLLADIRAHLARLLPILMCQARRRHL